MSRACAEDGRRNLIAQRLIALRKERYLSQGALARELQLVGMDMGKSVITRIETNKRHVTDVELQALIKVLETSYQYLIEGEDAPLL